MSSNILSPTQLSLLEEMGKNSFITEQFYLTGGTALAGFYLHHRLSEDLDFFSENEFDLLNIQIFFKKLQKKIVFEKLDFQQSYNRNLFFLHFTKEILKIEFTYFPFPRIDATVKQGKLQIDSLVDIAVNKLFSIYQRTVARDYIDLYFLCREKGFVVKDLLKQARIKFDVAIDPLQLGTQFVKAETAADLPRMLVPVAEADWRDFFIKEAKKLKPDILE